ncbi:MAG: TolC family protein [Acidobacteria bacterium]|nr:TolC family protein [Acidobacteriota bacterium]
MALGPRTPCVLAILLALAASPTAAQPSPPPASPTFTLADALARARTEAPESAAARARVEAAGQAVGQAARGPNPVFEFRLENWASGVSRSVLPYDAFAEVTQVVEIGGKRGARRGVAEAALGSSQAAEALTAQMLALDISRAYLDAVRLRDRQRTLSAQATDLGEMVRVLDRRVSLGTTAESELLKLRTEEARAATELIRTELAANRALSALAARLNVDVTLDALALPPPPPAPGAIDDDAALRRRPDVVSAERAVSAARQALRLEDARAVPDPAVNAGLKRTVGYNTGLFTVTMPVPLFNHNRAARIVAQGQVTAAELELAATERRARGDLVAARAAAQRLGERARDIRSRLVDPARGARDAARAAFATGAGDVLRLVDAERVFADAALIAIDLETDAVVAAIEARLAAGEDPLP